MNNINASYSIIIGDCTYVYELYCKNCGTECESCEYVLLNVNCNGGGSSGTGSSGNGTSSGTSGSGTSGSGSMGSGSTGTGGGGGTTGTGTTNTQDNDNILNPAPIGVLPPNYKQEIIDCLNAATLNLTQTNWLNNASALELKTIIRWIKSAGCDTMKNIIRDYIDNNISITFNEYTYNILKCNEVQNLINNAYIQQSLTVLEAYVSNSNPDEQGFDVSKINNVISTSFVPGNATGVYLSKGPNIIGGMHIHPDIGDEMFSGEDVFNLLKYALINTSASDYEAFLTLTVNNGTYMIKIKEIASLQFIINTIGDNKLNFRLQKEYKDNTNATAYENGFLKAFEKLKNKYNLPESPIWLYKLNSTGTGFNELTLDPNNPSGLNPPIATPCN